VKKTEVYIRDYKKFQEDQYYQLITNIKNNSFEGDSTDKKYLIFDGDFVSRIHSDLSKKYDSTTSEAKITIEKMGKDVERDSEIEKMLKEKGFKREIEDKK
jgi:hypothetical protein